MKKPCQNPGGRPTKLTEPLIQKICKFLHAGAYIETAAAASDVHKATLYEWLKSGAAIKRDEHELTPEDALLVRFSDAVEKAMAESEITALKQIDAAARSGIWQASAWRLERKFPQRWGRKICAEIPDEKPPQPEETKANQIDLSKLPTEVLKEYEQIVEKILALTGTPEMKGQTP